MGKRKAQKLSKNRIGLMLVLLMILLTAGCAGRSGSFPGSTSDAAAGTSGEKESYPMSRDLYLLDTFCQLTVYEGGGKEALDVAAAKLEDLDALLDYNKESSDLWRINNRTEEKVPISEDTAKLLLISEEISDLSDGALEPAIRPVTWLWDFKEEKKVPSKEDLEKALSEVVPGAWHVEEETSKGSGQDAAGTKNRLEIGESKSGQETTGSGDGQWFFIAEDPRVRIDVGAVAKGFVADRIKDVMLGSGVTSAIINLGGNVLCIGEKPGGMPFKIAVRDPRTKSGYGDKIFELRDSSAVTAGTYERSFEEDGVTYHHILDPVTGMPVQNGLISVTVTGPESAVCDALCTAIFVKGETDGKALLERYNEENSTHYEVYFLK